MVKKTRRNLDFSVVRPFTMPPIASDRFPAMISTSSWKAEPSIEWAQASLHLRPKFTSDTAKMRVLPAGLCRSR